MLMCTLAGCATASPEASSPSPTGSVVVGSTTTPTVTAPPSPIPTAAASTVPACDELLPVEQVRALLSEERITTVEVDPDLNPGVGPVAQATFETATTSTSCGYGIPDSDGGFVVTVAVIPAVSRGALVTALSSSSEYAHSSADGVEMFTIEVSDGIGSVLAYVFDGPVWATAHGTMLSADSAIAVARTAAGAALPANG